MSLFAQTCSSRSGRSGGAGRRGSRRCGASRSRWGAGRCIHNCGGTRRDAGTAEGRGGGCRRRSLEGAVSSWRHPRGRWRVGCGSRSWWGLDRPQAGLALRAGGSHRSGWLRPASRGCCRGTSWGWGTPTGKNDYWVLCSHGDSPPVRFDNKFKGLLHEEQALIICRWIQTWLNLAVAEFPHDSAEQKWTFSAFAAQKFGSLEGNTYLCTANTWDYD